MLEFVQLCNSVLAVLSGNVFLTSAISKNQEDSHEHQLSFLLSPFTLLFLCHTPESLNTAYYPGGGAFSPFPLVLVYGLRQTQLC